MHLGRPQGTVPAIEQEPFKTRRTTPMPFIIAIVACAVAIAFVRWLFTGIIPESWFRAIGRTAAWTLRIGVFALIGFFIWLGFFYKPEPTADASATAAIAAPAAVKKGDRISLAGQTLACFAGVGAIPFHDMITNNRAWETIDDFRQHCRVFSGGERAEVVAIFPANLLGGGDDILQIHIDNDYIPSAPNMLYLRIISASNAIQTASAATQTQEPGPDNQQHSAAACGDDQKCLRLWYAEYKPAIIQESLNWRQFENDIADYIAADRHYFIPDGNGGGRFDPTETTIINDLAGAKTGGYYRHFHWSFPHVEEIQGVDATALQLPTPLP
jgi:hypothetical protein